MEFIFLLHSIGQRKEGFRKTTHVYRGMWKVAKGKKVEIALKFLKQDQKDHLSSYLNLMGQWAFLKSSALVQFLGISFAVNETAFVMEYFKLGPLDQYLRNNVGNMRTVDLVEATNNLASALWHLKENNIVHGVIRCRKLMVYSHTEEAFIVKLADNGIFTPYEASDIHWIPIECYSNQESRTTAGDVYAFATTLYEIFTYGKDIPTAPVPMQTIKWYLSGHRLPQPEGCPDEIYTLMTECWCSDPQRRKQPQEISRDVNQLLYQVYNSRKKHSYDMVLGISHSSVNRSTPTNEASDTLELINADDPEITPDVSEHSLSDTSSQQWLLPSMNFPDISDDNMSESLDISQMFSNINMSTATTSLDSLHSLQSIFELDASHNVVLKGRIGQGYYGEVYKGTLEKQNLTSETFEPTIVAIKKLKPNDDSVNISDYVLDFQREISIMKGLKHPKIVEILGVLREPDLLLVMEYVPHGSLQSYLKHNKHNKDKVTVKQLLKFASDIAVGMDYLGRKNIIHRDLAARNILVADENNVKISDFGLAQFKDSGDYYILKNLERKLPIKWYAPESLLNGKFSVKSDVWSYGVTLFEMFNYGQDPPNLGTVQNSDGKDEVNPLTILLTAIENGERYPCPEDCPQIIYVNLMRPCWEANPHERPHFKRLMSEVEKLMQGF